MTDRLDKYAVCGYRYAAFGESMPRFEAQIDIDAFNAGISNYNIRNSAHIPKITEGMKTVYIQGANNQLSDKELAIVGV